jgi:hypothetical protein
VLVRCYYYVRRIKLIKYVEKYGYFVKKVKKPNYRIHYAGMVAVRGQLCSCNKYRNEKLNSEKERQ